MKKGKKILKRTLVIFGVLLLVILLDILFWLGPTVKVLAEWIGPKALGTPVTIESLSINPRKGTVLLSGLAIANQEAYGRSNAVELAHLDIAVDMASLFSKTVSVQRVWIDGPHFVFEQSEASDNIAEFIQSALDFAGYDPDAPPKEEKEKKEKPEKKPKFVMVESVNITDAQLHIVHTHDPMLNIGLRVGELNASMTNGVVQLKDLKIANPNRLSTRTLFTLEGIDILIDPATFNATPLTILDLQINQPHAFVEWAQDASTISEFLSIVESSGERVSAWPMPENRKPEEAIESAPEPAPPPVLRKAAVTDLQFHLVNSVDPLLSIQCGVEKAEADLANGSIRVDRIYVSNPSRLTLPDLFSLDSIDIRLDPESLYSPTLSIRDVQVQRPYAFLEANGESDTVSELLKIADTITGSLPEGSADDAAPKPAEKRKPDATAPPPFELHNLTVEDIQVKLLNATLTNAPSQPIMLAGIGSISAQLVDGQLQIADLTVPNPAGFYAANLFHLGGIAVAIDPASVFSGQTVIHEVFIDSPDIHLEQTETTGNFTELQKSLMPFMPPNPDVGEPEPAAAPASASTHPPVSLAEQPVVLESLLVTNLTISAIFQPPPAVTNEPPRDRLGKAAMRSLNPMTYIERGETNKAPVVNAEEISLLSFDLLHVEPLKGSIEISDLHVGNAQGFANRYLARFEQFSLQLDPDTLMSDTLIINKIRIDRPGVAYERKVMTDNIRAFQQTIEGAMSRRGETMDEARKQHDAAKGESRKVIIELLLVEHGTVKAKISALPTATIPLPTIEQKGIGKEEGGATVTEAYTRIFTVFYDSIIGVVANTTGIAGDALKGAGAFTLDSLGNVTGSLGGFVGMEGKARTQEAKQDEPEEEEKKNRSPFRMRRFHK